MNRLSQVFFLLLFMSTGASANVIDFNKVFVPAFKAEAQIFSREEIKVTEVYLESYTDFIQCLIACNYDLKVSQKKIGFIQSSAGELILKNVKDSSERFYKIASRVNECGASLIVKGTMGKKTYFSRIDLYKRFSKASKLSCAKSSSIERTLDELLSRPLELKRWIEVDPSR